jgi:hypothetical protein
MTIQNLHPVLAASYHASGNGLQAISQWLLLLMGLAIVALLIVGLYFWNTLRKPGRTTGDESGYSLFAELCATHQLSRVERSLLTNLVNLYSVSQPAVVFVDPSALDRAVAAADPDAPRYEVLRRKLFGTIEV